MSAKVNMKNLDAWGKNMTNKIWSADEKCPKNHTDIIFKCHDGKIASHRGLLKTTCLTIHRVLQTLPSEIQNIDEKITFIVPDFSIRTVHKFLEMIYTGSTGLEKFDDLDNIIQFATKHLGFFIAVNFNVFIEKVKKSVGNLVINLEPEIQPNKTRKKQNKDMKIACNDSGLGTSLNESGTQERRTSECEVIDLAASVRSPVQMEPDNVDVIDLEQFPEIPMFTQNETTQIVEIIEIDANKPGQNNSESSVSKIPRNDENIMEIDEHLSEAANNDHSKRRKKDSSTSFSPQPVMTKLYLTNIEDVFEDFENKMKKEKKESNVIKKLLINGQTGLVEGSRTKRSRSSRDSQLNIYLA